jgi:diguanylate cyclase (GGDEF)-like protein/PAS domain S-box-containing protein
MNFLDVRTILFGHLATTSIGALVVILLWLQNRHWIDGTFYWVLDFLFQTMAVLLIILRGVIPDWISFVLANSLIITGAYMGFLGLERFTGMKSPQVLNGLFLGIFIAIHSYFSFAAPELKWRNINLSAGILFYCFQCAWLAFFRVPKEMRRITRGAGVVFGLFVLVNLIRIIFILALPYHYEDIFKSGLFDALILISYQLLLILVAYTLNLMVNRRLLQDIGLQEEKFSKAFQSSPYALMLTRLNDGKIMEVNEGFIKLSGYNREDVIGKTTQEMQLWSREEDRSLLVKELSERGRMEGKEFIFRIQSGEFLIGLVSAETLQIHGEPFILASIRDITARKKAEEALMESEERYRQVVENANEAILVAQDGMIKFHNLRVKTLIGYSDQELREKPFTDFIHPEDRELVSGRYQERLQGHEVPHVYSFRIIDKVGKVLWVEINSVLMDWERRPATLNFLDDITNRKAMEEQLQKMSVQDELTGLYNRRGFLTLSEQQFRIEERRRKPMILFFADLDNMKMINDNLGHQEGDQALRSTAQILKETFRESDIIARIGGDEFAVLALETAGVNPEFLISRLQKELEDFNKKGSRPFRLSLSIGLAGYDPEHPISLDSLLAEADRRMYEQKRNKNFVAVHQGVV